MLSRCANPECGKPLHYLREGRVFLFNVPTSGTDGPISPQREHFWLCGECSMAYSMTQQENQAARLVALHDTTQRKFVRSTIDASRELRVKIAVAAAS